MFAQRFGN